MVLTGEGWPRQIESIRGKMIHIFLLYCMSKHAGTFVHSGDNICICSRYKQEGENNPQSSYVCVCSLSSLISGLVFSNVRFRNTHALHNSSRSRARKKGERRGGAHIYVRQHPALPLTEGITGENLLFHTPMPTQHLRFRASIKQFSSLSTASGSIFSGY